MARPELPGAAVHHSVARSSISVGGSHPLFQPPAKNALLFFVWLWYIGLGIVKAALKSSIFLFFLEQLCYFNLSPQGDGNFHGLCCIRIQANISTYPRKGTETSKYNYHQDSQPDFNLSPQGDENCLGVVLFAKGGLFQLIPARGRKLIPSSIVPTAFMISTYPRKGTKTFLVHRQKVVKFQLIPARGRKLTLL